LQSPYEPVTAGLVERQGDDHRQRDLLVESDVVIGSMSPGSDSCKNTSRSLPEVAADEIEFVVSRDEIRDVAPHVYLRKVYLGKKRLTDFALEFPAPGVVAS
jgi:hypothetical protein